QARVTVPQGDGPEGLVPAAEQAGYAAALPAPARTAPADADGQDGQDGQEPEDPELTSLRHRLIGAVLLAVPVIVISMIPALQFTHWQWAVLTLTAPVVVWAAWPFHRATLINLRHGAATMDTLITVGTVAAF